MQIEIRLFSDTGELINLSTIPFRDGEVFVCPFDSPLFRQEPRSMVRGYKITLEVDEKELND